MQRDSQQDGREWEEELARSARAAPEGDMWAFEQLVQLYQKRILADCCYLTRDEQDAEDLAQEVFVKAFFGLRHFEGRSSFRHWLQRIKVHHCLNHLKKSRGHASVSIGEEAEEDFEQLRVAPTAERAVEASEDRARIHGILNSMPATLRVPLVLRDMDEFSYEEIAASLGLGLSAVKMRVKRARERFRRLYQGVEHTVGGAAPG